MPKLIKNVGGQHVEEPTVPISAGAGSAGRVPELNGAGGLDPSLLPDFYTRLAVQSRGMNLVTNGTALMRNNYNFSQFEYYPQDVFSGAASFLGSTTEAVYALDELIPVNPSKYYRGDVALKTIQHAPETDLAYAYSLSIDIDGLSVTPDTYLFDIETYSHLTQPLSPGDTVIHVDDASGWGGRGVNWIKIHSYTNSLGYTWQPKTYSRTVHFIYSGGGGPGYFVFNDEDIDKTANTIGLAVPWGGGLNGQQTWNPASPDGTWPVGTPISTCGSAGTFQYFLASAVRVPTEWTTYTGVIGGFGTPGLPLSANFPAGTAFIRLGFLLNYPSGVGPGPGGPAKNTMAVSALSFSEVTAENLSGGRAGWNGTYTAQDGRTVTVHGGIITGVV